MTRGILCGALLFCVGCGEPEPEAFRMRVAFPGYLALDGCGMPASLRAVLRAQLEVGGHEETPCTLAVDPTSLGSSGTCGGIVAGILRPLGLAFSVPDPITGEVRLLAYTVGWVDLSPEALDPGTTDVPISLTPDGEHGTQVDTQTERDLLATQAQAELESNPQRSALLKAEVWARGRLAYVDFDCDVDGQSNLAEACAGTLF